MSPSSRALPSDHESARIKREAEEQLHKEAQKRKEGQLQRAVDWLLKQENGRIFWSYLFNACGANKSSLSYFAGGDVAPLKTECKEAQRLVYLELRKLVVSAELLSKVEHEAEFGVAISDEQETKGGKGNGKRG